MLAKQALYHLLMLTALSFKASLFLFLEIKHINSEKRKLKRSCTIMQIHWFQVIKTSPTLHINKKIKQTATK
jgi:hypothetical protein